MSKKIKKEDILKELKEKFIIKTTSENKRIILEELVKEGKSLRINDYYVESEYYKKLLNEVQKELDKNFYFKPSNGAKKKIYIEILNDLHSKNKVIKVNIGKSLVYIKKGDYVIPPIFDIVKDIQDFYLSQSIDRKFGFTVSLENVINFLINKYSLSENQLIKIIYDLRRILSNKLVLDKDKTKKQYQLPNQDYVSVIILYDRIV